MLGAEILVRSLVAGGIDTCLGNPGTSEMHFVAALDRAPGLRSVLTLFEGVATGAADGYARVAGRPACRGIQSAWRWSGAAPNPLNSRSQTRLTHSIIPGRQRKFLLSGTCCAENAPRARLNSSMSARRKR